MSIFTFRRLGLKILISAHLGKFFGLTPIVKTPKRHMFGQKPALRHIQIVKIGKNMICMRDAESKKRKEERKNSDM